MQRRNVLKTLALGTASTASVAAVHPVAQAQAPEPSENDGASFNWRMVTSWPQQQNITFQSVVTFCDRVKAMTDGQLVITPYEAGQLADALDVFSVVQAGEVECGHTVSYYYLDQNPALVFGTSLPFGLTPYQQYAWLYYGGGLEAIQAVHAPLNLMAFPAGSPGVQMGGWFNREVETVADLKGLKIRIPGFGADVMRRLGADPVQLGGGEIYAALERGDIDAAEWQNPYEDEQLRLYEVARYYYYPGWWEPGSTYEVVINQQQWEQLPKPYQRVVQAAAAESNLTMLAEFDAANGRALENLLIRGVELKPYSSEILEAAHAATFELLEETARQHADFKQIYDQWRQFRRQMFQWNQVNELSFERFTLQTDES
jgi:TRAP-type mannitol/chloroaromatic compound transport system substrate-binding protein